MTKIIINVQGWTLGIAAKGRREITETPLKIAIKEISFEVIFPFSN